MSSNEPKAPGPSTAGDPTPKQGATETILWIVVPVGLLTLVAWMYWPH